MKKIVLCITGSIAAYKSVFLLRLLKQEGFDVRVIMTKASESFIAPLTFQSLSQNKVVSDIMDAENIQGMGHIELAKWADIIVVAPATANTIAKIANGMADDLLSSMILATNKPVLIAPSMNQQMWANSITQENIQKLKQHNFIIVGPDSGEQACGDIGAGRMSEPSDIFTKIKHKLNDNGAFKGKTVLITAGATLEAIDPVRYISNHSSGKMANALVKAFKEEGARVIVISGLSAVDYIDADKVLSVKSADEMLNLARIYAKESDIFVAAAAVCDFKVAEIAEQKIKKSVDNEVVMLKLQQNKDILKTISFEYPHLFKVGFAAETEYLEENALKKLQAKALDMICANDVSNGQAFGKDDNALIILTKDNEKYQFTQQKKEALAKEIVSVVLKKS